MNGLSQNESPYLLEQSSSMNIDEIIDCYKDGQTLEIYNDYFDKDVHFDEIVIPYPVRIFVTDIQCNKIFLPDTINVLDIWNDNHNLEFNIPTKLQTIKMRNTNIINNNLMKLFTKVSYRYTNCSLNGISLNILLNQQYKKYFNEDPKYICNREEYKGLMNNTIYSKIHKNIINEIVNYEERIQQGKEFCTTIYDELIERVWNPDRICPIKMYGIEYLEKL